MICEPLVTIKRTPEWGVRFFEDIYILSGYMRIILGLFVLPDLNHVATDDDYIYGGDDDEVE